MTITSRSGLRVGPRPPLWEDAVLRRSTRALVVLAAGVAATSSMGVARAYSPPTELHGQFGKVTPLVNAAMIQKTNGGYRFTAGKQNSHITVTMGHGKIHFRDTGTRELRNIPKQCKRHSAGKGIGAVCNVPRGYNARHPMYVEVWPRLGNDYVNGRSLPASTRLWV